VTAVLAVDGLRKAYGETAAVDGVSFEVQPGEILGLLGPNGARKTTTINMVLGVVAPDAGTIRIEDVDLAKHRSEALERTNFAAVYAPLPGNLTVEQNLRVFGLLYGVTGLRHRIAELLEEYDLERFRRTKCGVLSSGETTRVSLAKAMLNRPRLLLLDEPTASLDPASAREVRARIQIATQGSTGVLWTSHNMYEVAEVCRRVQGVTMAFFEDVWARNFLNVFATPIRIAEYLSGLVVSSIATSAVGLVVMVGVAMLVFGLSFSTYGVLLAPFLAVLFLFGIALGMTGAAIVLRLGPAAEWFIWPLPAIISPFASALYPVSTLPHWMQLVARALPPAYVFEGLRSIILGRPAAPGSLAVGAVLAVLYLALACLFFARIHRYAVRTGLIGRYAAETVS
jgi:ABC-2 type transport system ATP-binding protein